MDENENKRVERQKQNVNVVHGSRRSPPSSTLSEIQIESIKKLGAFIFRERSENSFNFRGTILETGSTSMFFSPPWCSTVLALAFCSSTFKFLLR